MKFYSIFLKEGDKGVVKDLVLLKDGFNPYTFIFGIFWFLYKKCYVISLLLISVTYFISSFFSLKFAMITNLILFFVLSFESDRILITKYVKENYRYLGYTSGKSEIEAKRRFLDSINNDGIENKTTKQDD